MARRRRKHAPHLRRRAPTLRSAPPDGGNEQPVRLIARGRADRVRTFGLPKPWFGDLYHQTLQLPWWAFLLSGALLYVLANAAFAILYLAQPGSIAHARPGSFWDAFFFSVETIATVGYGEMSPATFYGNLVMAIETGTGLMLVALATGLVFARFSRPRARMLFSRVAVIGTYNGTPTLSMRLANERRNQIVQAEVTAHLVRDEQTSEGMMIRRFYDLKLARDHTPIFALTFTIMHEIDADSPLYGLGKEDLETMRAELVITASGIDETIVQLVHARTSYLPHEIHWNHRFVDVMGWSDDGNRLIDYRGFHDTVPLTSRPRDTTVS